MDDINGAVEELWQDINDGQWDKWEFIQVMFDQQFSIEKALYKLNKYNKNTTYIMKLI